MSPNNLIKALEQKYKAEIAEGEANVGVYIDNPAGIGEHPDIVGAIDTQVARIAEAKDKLKILQETWI